MLIIYKTNLAEFLKEASFAVYTSINIVSSNQHYQTIRIVLSAWNYEDQPIQLQINCAEVIHGDSNNLKIENERAIKQLADIQHKIGIARLEVRDGIFGSIDKPLTGALL